MARFTNKAHTASVLAAAETWRDRSLRDELSSFGPARLWTEGNLLELHGAFLGNPLIGGQDSFLEKLTKQLEGTAPATKQLAAECVWLLYLFVSSDQFGEELKRERVMRLWELSGQSLPKTRLLNDEALEGLANPGPAFMTKIPDELAYLLDLMVRWRQLSSEARDAYLTDPWELSRWVSSVPGSDRRAFRAMFLYLVFPDYFERVVSRGHKRKILEKFGTAAFNGESDPLTAIDRALLDQRQRLEQEYGTDKIDYYNAPLRDRWQDVAPAPPPEVAVERRVWIEKTLVRGRTDRMAGDDALGVALWSPQRSAGGGDIYSTMRRVRPGDIVLHLTDNEAITRVSIAATGADDSFEGLAGTDWEGMPAYRIELKDSVPVEPPLTRAQFFNTAPFSDQLRALLGTGQKGVFYSSDLELRQGGYLTEAPPQLVAILNNAYRAVTSRDLPYIDAEKFPDLITAEGTAPSAKVGSDAADLFLEPEEIQDILDLWSSKKNVILQGPPGVGKSFAARRLAHLLMGQLSDDCVGFVQFHQSYSYEDFVEGYRPTGDGFALRTGRFVEFCARAAADPERRYVFVIDEINRGNLSKILGELMLLIEADKRDPSWAVSLAYSGNSFHVPENVFLLGLMNTADRSLAVVDYALRRRFGFVDLVPKLGSQKFAAVLERNGLSADTLELVRSRVGALNAEIIEDTTNLGAGFAIGHSFFCGGPLQGEAGADWYGRVIRTEILPLLREYWFDARDKVTAWEDRLLAGL